MQSQFKNYFKSAIYTLNSSNIQLFVVSLRAGLVILQNVQ